MRMLEYWTIAPMKDLDRRNGQNVPLSCVTAGLIQLFHTLKQQCHTVNGNSMIRQVLPGNGWLETDTGPHRILTAAAAIAEDRSSAEADGGIGSDEWLVSRRMLSFAGRTT